MSFVKWLRMSTISAAVAFAGIASAEPLKLATMAPEGSVWHSQMMKFVDALRASGLEVDVFASGQLGNMPDTLKSTLAGRIDIWTGASVVLSAVAPELALFNLPYLFDSADQAKCVIPKMYGMGRQVAGEKFTFLAFSAIAGQDVFGTKPIRLPSDLKGEKTRIAPIPASVAFFSAMGAAPQSLPAFESASAVSTGLVKVLEFDIIYYLLAGVNRGAAYMTQTDHNHNFGAYIMSPRTWARLDDAQKAAVQAAAEKIDFGANWDEVEAFERTMLEKAKASGTVEIVLTPEEKAQWVDVGRSVWDQVINETRGDPKGFLAALEEARTSCK